MNDEKIVKCKVCKEHNTFIIPDDGYVHWNKCKNCGKYIDNFGRKMEEIE
jgi:translation initiation factor 2 beta subunit (eIF-2beta)/eIF-5